MDWYFAQDGQRYGPVAEEAFGALLDEGRVLAQTLVWHEGLANWQTLEQTLPGAEAAEAPAAPLLRGYCSQCRRQFSTEDMIAYDGRWICAVCKPRFFQQLREGLPAAVVPPAQMAFAGFWIRAAAKLLDSMIVSAPMVVLGMGLFWSNWEPRHSAARWLDSIVPFATQVLMFFVWVAYDTLMLGRWGATVGKMACGLRVVRADGSKITYARALGRSACSAGALALVGCLGFVMFIIAAFDSQKRAGQDHICGTRVVYKGR